MAVYNISANVAAKRFCGGKALTPGDVAAAEQKLCISFPDELRAVYLDCGGFDIGAKSRVFSPDYISRLEGEDTAYIIGTSGERLACIFSKDMGSDDPDVYLGTLAGRSLDFSVNQKLSQLLRWVIFEAVTEKYGEVIGVDDKGEIDELARKLSLDKASLTDGTPDSCFISIADGGRTVFANTDANGEIAVLVVIDG